MQLACLGRVDAPRTQAFDKPARREPGDHEARRVAALQDGGHARARKERLETVLEGLARRAAELCPEGTLHDGLNHTDAPQNQRHRAWQASPL